MYSHSGVENFELRKTVRSTWGNTNVLKKDKAALFFVLGTSRNEWTQKQVEKEAEEYKDIVQADFVDDYYNLTYKAFMAIQWLNEHCKHVPTIVKTDDDIFWDVETVLTMLRDKMEPRSVMCRMYYKNAILRNPNTCGKWCARKDEFRGLSIYPKYCEGLIYAFDSAILEELSIIMKHTSFFSIEDVWVGYNMHQLFNINYKDIRFYVADIWAKMSQNYRLGCFDQKLITHVKGQSKAHVVRRLWNSLTILRNKIVSVGANKKTKC